MRLNNLFLYGTLFILSAYAYGTKPSRNLPTAEQKGTYVHGTIDVVVQTKDGFVLAGDSRGSNGNGQPLPGEYQKVFAIGPRTGCVVAGLIATNTPPGEFVAKEDIVGPLQFADQTPEHSTAIRAASLLMHLYGSELSLLPADYANDPGIEAHLSCASVANDGNSQWLTLKLHPRKFISWNGTPYLSEGHAEFVDPPASRVQAIGMPAIVNYLISLSAPSNDAYSTTPALIHYYDLKRNGKLSELTLDDGIALAQILEKATIENAGPGVGGSVDILVVTKQGTEWKAKKTDPLPPAPPFKLRTVSSSFEYTKMQLDGQEFVNPVFLRDIELTYAGGDNTKLIHPTFKGACSLVLAPTARKNLSVTLKLEKEVHDLCDIYEELRTGGRKELSASGRKLSAPDLNPYPALSTPALCQAGMSIAPKMESIARQWIAEEAQQERQRSQREFSGVPTNGTDWRINTFRSQVEMEERFLDRMETSHEQFGSACNLLNELIKRNRASTSESEEWTRQCDIGAFQGNPKYLLQTSATLRGLASKLAK